MEDRERGDRAVYEGGDGERIGEGEKKEIELGKEREIVI